MANEKRTNIKPGERIDQIAQRVYGDDRQYRRILVDNPEMIDIFYPVVEQQLVVSDD